MKYIYIYIYVLLTRETKRENSLVVQWLGLGALTPEGPGSIPGQEIKIPQDTRHSQKKKKRRKAIESQCIKASLKKKLLYNY